jgi:signal transduction histidine kinase
LDVIVCASSKPAIGVVVVQDASGLELLELGQRDEEIRPGERIVIEGSRLLLRRRELGTQISAAPVLDNDGIHAFRLQTNEIALKAGRIPLEVDWFNCLRNFGLEVSCQQSNGPLLLTHESTGSTLWRARSEFSAAETNLVPGLQAECYEGFWERVPDFDLLRPVRTGTTTNVDLSFRTRDELVGLRFTGWFDAPRDGTYTFRLGSDDGSLLFIGPVEVPLKRVGSGQVPPPEAGVIGQLLSRPEERRWLAVAGRVSFVSQVGKGLQLELRSGVDTLSVRVADASGLDPASLLTNVVRAVGLGCAAFSASGRIILDRLLVPDARGLTRVEMDAEPPGRPPPPVNIDQVQAMSLEDANRRSQVRIRGVVTGSSRSDHWVSLQDDTRGIFVDLSAMSNSFPARTELWEVVGRTARGNFAPIVVAEEMTRRGQGRMPEPARPTWNELANGSMDVQWVELRGLVSEVQTNRLTLLMPEGALWFGPTLSRATLYVAMENYFEPELAGYLQAVVRIRGTLFANWIAATREVQFGSLIMRNATIRVDTPAPLDPLNAPMKTVHGLLRFDAQATAFRPVKVRAQVLYADARRIFAMDERSGLRILAAEDQELQPGDLIEAVGYPEISGPSPVLREAFVRKTGTAQLPEPEFLAEPERAYKGLDSTLVSVRGKLMGKHSEQDSQVLEIQSHGQLFVARVKAGERALTSLRPESQLQLVGVYTQTGPSRGPVGAFELLVNAPADVVVLSQPSWWTLARLGIVVGLLLVVLLLAAGWITQLRRQVEQRSAQLQEQIRERERAERDHALEAERSRIARDLHDDLGSNLTEIGALASTGQRASTLADGSPGLFDAIARKARGSIAALDVIVWAVDPEDNSLQSLADYLSGFAGEYLSNSSIACRFKVPVGFPAFQLEGRVRHDLFLAVKEALSNVVRHAQATEAEFAMSASDGTLNIFITDNGKGFETSVAHDGNGLVNLRERLVKLGGVCAIASRVGAGTTVNIRLPLPSPEAT